MAEPAVLDSGGKVPRLGFLPGPPALKHYALTGFEIPSLPVLPAEKGSERASPVEEILYRFQLYLRGLDLGPHRSIALQFMAHPEKATLDSRVRVYLLCGSSHDDLKAARADAAALGLHAAQSFPKTGIFSYGQPVWLSAAELEHACFRPGGKTWPEVDVVELRKFEDHWAESQQAAMQYVPHRLWPDRRLDPWPLLIENLAAIAQPAAIRIELTSARLDRATGLNHVSIAGRWFTLYSEDLARHSSQGEQVRTDGVVTEEMRRAGDVQSFSGSARGISYVQRGRHVFQELVANADRLFGLRVTLAARGAVPESLVGAVRAALSSPPDDDPEGAVGWVRPEVLRPAPPEMEAALQNLHFLAQTRWGRSPPSPGPGPHADLRHLVTPEEAVSLFHLPVFDRTGETSALSTAETPFVIPPESLNKHRLRPDDKPICVGYLYQRDRLLQPDATGKNAQPFCVTTSDLMKPSLLVGAPGSGKSNLAFSLLIQLWKKHRVPFLVLDPSTGEEYRLLLRDPSLRKELVVYTVGDLDGLPLQFNPFSVPPGVTVRNHTTRILAAFRAAFTMFDPVPAIYEGALERLYTSKTYNQERPVMRMEDKGTLKAVAPTLSDFAAAIQDELTEKALTFYQGSAESIGIIRGASTIRVNAIGKKLGYILNTPQRDGRFFQKLLERPAIIELGALGDTSNIALLMAFLISQLAGHVEYASRQLALEKKKREHVILIEEAHRLLGAGEGEGVESKSAEDLNMMLAEVRKFGQGIMILDQRPSSLVGGVLDNAFVKILTRLSDRVGFERLSDELNLNEAQQRFARTRLKAGDAILLDRDAGQPVLVRAENVKDGLEKRTMSAVRERRRMTYNAKKWQLMPPDSATYVEPAMPAADAKAAASPAASAGPPALPQLSDLERWQQAERTKWLQPEMDSLSSNFMDMLWRTRTKSELFDSVGKEILKDKPNLDRTKAVVELALKSDRPEFDRLVGEIWEKMQWMVAGIIADEKNAPSAGEQIRARQDGESTPRDKK
jgi:hypothetical protein